MQQHVRMRFDQTRHQCGAWKIDRLCLRRRFHICRWSHAFDLLVAYEHGPTTVQLRRFTVEDLSRFQQINGGWLLRRLRSLSKKLRGNQANKDQTKVTHG